jgi:hypothetical protein
LDNLKEKNKVLDFEGESTGSHSVEKPLWKRLLHDREHNDEEINFIVSRDKLELENGSSWLLRYTDIYSPIGMTL